MCVCVWVVLRFSLSRVVQRKSNETKNNRVLLVLCCCCCCCRFWFSSILFDFFYGFRWFRMCTSRTCVYVNSFRLENFPFQIYSFVCLFNEALFLLLSFQQINCNNNCFRLKFAFAKWKSLFLIFVQSSTFTNLIAFTLHCFPFFSCLLIICHGKTREYVQI